MRYWTLLIVMMIVAVSVAVSLGEQEAPDEPLGVAMVAIGDVDPAMFDRVHSFVEDQYSIPIDVLAPVEATETLSEAVDVAEEMLRPNHLFILGLVRPGGDEKAHGIYLPDRKVTIVNAKALKENAADEETYGRRLERQSMRGLAMLFGMSPCPNPHCALCGYDDDKQMDQLGRGLCPPCLFRVKEAAKERGVKLIEKPVPSFVR